MDQDWKTILLDGNGLRLPEWLLSGQAAVVKDRPQRTVYRVHLPEGSFYVKLYHSRGVRDFLRRLARGSTAKREWRRIQQVRACGIAAVRPLAVGESRTMGIAQDDVLVTAALDDAAPLDEYLQQHLPRLSSSKQTRARQALAACLGRFVADLHAAGIVHKDLHPGNLLVATPGERSSRADCASAFKLYLVDLQAVSQRRGFFARAGNGRKAPILATAQVGLGPRASLRNLVVLNLYFSQRATRADRQRFWQHYVRTRPDLFADPHEAAKRLETLTKKASLRFWQRRDRRCVQENRYFVTCRARRCFSHVRAFAVRDFPRHLLESLLRDPEAPWCDGQTRLLKRSSGSVVARIAIAGHAASGTFVYKRWSPRNRREWLYSWLRRSKGLHAWRMSHAFLQRELLTPRALACIEQAHWKTGVCSYVLWEEIRAAQNLDQFLQTSRDAETKTGRLADLRDLSCRLARTLRRMHELGFDHRDLKAANVLVQQSSDDSKDERDVNDPCRAAQIYLLDLDAAVRRRRISEARRLRNLMRLLVSFYRSCWFSRSDKLRFLDEYLSGGRVAHPDWKAFCRRLDHLARRKIKRNQSRGREIA